MPVVAGLHRVVEGIDWLGRWFGRGGGGCAGTDLGSRQTLPEHIGAVQLWWIAKPAAPRISIPAAGWTGLGLTAVLLATWLWVRASAAPRPFWPWSPYNPTLGQQLLKYELVLAGFVIYVVLASLPSWVANLRQAKRDARQLQEHVRSGQWSAAGRCLHRFCLLWAAVWGRLPGQARAWDELIRPHLQPGRRLYIYYRQRPPRLPDQPQAGYWPVQCGLSPPVWWGLAAVGALGLFGYQMLAAALRAGQWVRLASIDFVVLVVVLVGYACFYVARGLGRATMLRFSPRRLERVTFGLLRRGPRVQLHDLDRCDVVVDVSGRRPGLVILPRDQASKRASYTLPRRAELVEAALRAVLSQGEGGD